MKILISVIIGIFIGYFLFNEVSRNILISNKNNYLIKRGNTLYHKNNTLNWISYELRTFDGGKIWYVVETDLNDGSVNIIGVVDSIYPNLLQHIKSIDELYNYIEKNGSVDLNREDSSEQMILLKNLGIYGK